MLQSREFLFYMEHLQFFHPLARGTIQDSDNRGIEAFYKTSVKSKMLIKLIESKGGKSKVKAIMKCFISRWRPFSDFFPLTSLTEVVCPWCFPVPALCFVPAPHRTGDNEETGAQLWLWWVMCRKENDGSGHSPAMLEASPCVLCGCCCWWHLASALRQPELSAGVWPQDKHRLRGRMRPVASKALSRPWSSGFWGFFFWYSLIILIKVFLKTGRSKDFKSIKPA